MPARERLLPACTAERLKPLVIRFFRVYSERGRATLNPAIEVNVVDPMVRKGFRFKGIARIVEDGPEYRWGTELFRAMGVSTERDARPRVKAIVLVRVERALSLVHDGKEVSYREFNHRVDAAASV